MRGGFTGDPMELLFFYCYSERLKRALCANGFRYVCVGINERTDSRFYLFVSSPELQYYKDYIYPNERDEF